MKKQLREQEDEYMAKLKRKDREIDEGDGARRQLKNDLQELNDKMVNLEEDLFESKTI